MANAMLYEDYLRQQASRGQYGVCIIPVDHAEDIADWIEKNRDRIAVIRCADCMHWEPCNAEEGDFSGHCRKNAECHGALTDATFFCGSAERQ